MQHFDELILELYVLDAPEVQSRKMEITNHLVDCHGCRSIVEELREFYVRFDQTDDTARIHEESANINLIPVPTGDRHTHIRKRNAELEKLFETFPFTRHATAIGRIQHLFWRHPIIATTSGITMVAVAALAINFAATTIFKDRNPSYPTLNEGSSNLEVYNGKNQLLWGIPVRDISSMVKWQNESGVTLSAINDLENDGRNEVVTVVRNLGSENMAENLLHIFGADGICIGKVAFGRPTVFKGTKFDSDYFTEGLLVDESPDNGGKEIIVAAINSHSPCVITRLDAQGRILGEYWHYGQLPSAYSVDLDNDGRKKLILTGLEDVDDPSFPVIVVLDPKRIVDTTESIRSRGFGFSASVAELFYIQLPRTDLNDVLDEDYAVKRLDTLHYAGQPALRFSCSSNDTNEVINFQYIFSKDMRLLEIKPSEATIQLHAGLVGEGKLTGQIDRSYLDNLASNIRYWDGRDWSLQVVQVQHSTLP